MDYLSVNPYDVSSNRVLWRYYTGKGLYDSVIINATPLMQAFISQMDYRKAMYPAAYAAQAYLFSGKYDSLKRYVDFINENIAYLNEKDYLVSIITYNVLAIYAMKKNMDYSAALDYLKKALALARNAKDTLNSSILLSNISTLYYLREDVSGLEYAKEAYIFGKNADNPFIELSNICNLSTMYLLASDTLSALNCAEEAVGKCGSPGNDNSKTMAYRTYGDVLTVYKRYDNAGDAYEEAARYLIHADENQAVRLYLSKGNLSFLQGLYSNAMTDYNKALDIAEEYNNLEYMQKVLYGIYNTCIMIGDKDMAFDYFVRYNKVDSITFNLKKEKEFSNLLVKYERAKYEEELMKKELEIAQVRLKDVVIIFIAIIIIGFSIYSYILSVRSKQMYASLFEQYSQYRKKLNDIHAAVNLKKNNESKSIYTLFQNIDKLMNEQKLYRNKELSINTLAEQLDSNYTYVSKAINTYTGNNFATYINSYRIAEAISILSDSENNTPIKAISDKIGYTNITSFYRSFQNETGFTPSRFREEAKRRGH